MQPHFAWDPRSQRYRDARTGRFLPRKAIRAAMDGALGSAQKRVRALADQLRDGGSSLQDWQIQTAQSLKEIHLYSAALAKGGWDQMSPADFGRVGNVLRDQYGYLRNLAVAIAGGLLLDGRFGQRMTMYVQAGRATYHRTERAEMALRGFNEERNLRSAADSCAGCLAASASGWVPIGTLTPVGSRDCMSNCRCALEYRSISTGETL